MQSVSSKIRTRVTVSISYDDNQYTMGTWKALCIVMSFLILSSICWSSSLVHFKNGPENLTSGTHQVFITLMRFLLRNLVSSSFLVLLRYSFLLFLSFSLVWWCPLAILLSISKFPFLWSFWFFYLFDSSIPSVICLFLLFFISMAHFSMPNSVPISSLYIIFTQPLRSGRIWHKVNFLSGV